MASRHIQNGKFGGMGAKANGVGLAWGMSAAGIAKAQDSYQPLCQNRKAIPSFRTA